MQIQSLYTIVRLENINMYAAHSMSMQVRLGPAGIPLMCKGNNTLEGIRCAKAIGLSAMEIEFVRGVYLRETAAKSVGDIAKSLNIALSCHAPYYINLASKNPDVVEKSMKYISDTLRISDLCGATIAVIHAGFYTSQGEAETYALIKSAVSRLSSKAKIGIETMGRQKQFGTLDEIERLVQECENVAPVIDFAHIHARTGGSIKTKADFKKILDRFDRHSISPLHCHMTGIKYENSNEKHHIPISSFEPDFRLLAQLLNENAYNLTIISESPLLEEDALLFKTWLE